jgi:hypothetical protein
MWQADDRSRRGGIAHGAAGASPRSAPSAKRHPVRRWSNRSVYRPSMRHSNLKGALQLEGGTWGKKGAIYFPFFCPGGTQWHVR